jgi:hypothetical protein
MTPTRRRLVFLVLFTVGLAPRGWGQTGDPARALDPVRILAEREKGARGTASVVALAVDDNGTPISGVRIDLGGSGRSDTTDTRGRIRFDGLAAVPAYFRARKLGFAPFLQMLTLQVGEIREIAFTLRRLAATLPAATISARSGYGPMEAAFEDFDQRLRWRSVMTWALSADDLRNAYGAPLDLLARELGVLSTEETKKRRNALQRGVTSINISPTGRVAHPLEGPKPFEVAENSCILIDGLQFAYLPLRAFSARDLAFVEIFPPNSEVTTTVWRRMQGVCQPHTPLVHPTYYVLWLK